MLKVISSMEIPKEAVSAAKTPFSLATMRSSEVTMIRWGSTNWQPRLHDTDMLPSTASTPSFGTHTARPIISPAIHSLQNFWGLLSPIHFNCTTPGVKAVCVMCKITTQDFRAQGRFHSNALHGHFHADVGQPTCRTPSAPHDPLMSPTPSPVYSSACGNIPSVAHPIWQMESQVRISSS